MNAEPLWELIEHETELPEENFKLTQCQNIAYRLILAGRDGLLTAELFKGLHCAKYTGRISDLRRQGHIIQADQEKVLAGGLPTEQWRYRHLGFMGDMGKLHPLIKQAIEENRV